MSEFTFFKAFTILQEADAPPPAPPGGDDPMGGDPMGGAMPPPMGGDPMGGNPMGGDPMGGGGAGGQPIEVKSIAAADVWSLLDKIVKDEKYAGFFEEINIAKKQQPSKVYSATVKTSLMK